MIISTTIPSSLLKKKHNAIGYHRIREAVAAGIVSLIHVASKQNLADILTKPLGPQSFGLLLNLFSFPLIPCHLKHEGECQTGENNEMLGTNGSGSKPPVTIGISDWGT
jgi:hypothetical protein